MLLMGMGRIPGRVGETSEWGCCQFEIIGRGRRNVRRTDLGTTATESLVSTVLVLVMQSHRASVLRERERLHVGQGPVPSIRLDGGGARVDLLRGTLGGWVERGVAVVDRLLVRGRGFLVGRGGAVVRRREELVHGRQRRSSRRTRLSTASLRLLLLLRRRLLMLLMLLLLEVVLLLASLVLLLLMLLVLLILVMQDVLLLRQHGVPHRRSLPIRASRSSSVVPLSVLARRMGCKEPEGRALRWGAWGRRVGRLRHGLRMLALVRMGTRGVGGSVRLRVRADRRWGVGARGREEAVRLLVVGEVRDGCRRVGKVVRVGVVLLVLRWQRRRRRERRRAGWLVVGVRVRVLILLRLLRYRPHRRRPCDHLRVPQLREAAHLRAPLHLDDSIRLLERRRRRRARCLRCQRFGRLGLLHRSVLLRAWRVRRRRPLGELFDDHAHLDLRRGGGRRERIVEVDERCDRRRVLLRLLRVHRTRVLAYVVETRERAAAVTLERTLASMFPRTSSSSLARPSVSLLLLDVSTYLTWRARCSDLVKTILQSPKPVHWNMADAETEDLGPSTRDVWSVGSWRR